MQNPLLVQGVKLPNNSSFLDSNFLSILSQHFNVLCIDQIGHGRSENCPEVKLSGSENFQIFFQILKFLKIKNYFFISSAFGTQMAFHIKKLCIQNNYEIPMKIIIFGPGGLINTKSFNFWIHGTKRFYKLITKNSFLRVFKEDLNSRIIKFIQNDELRDFCNQQIEFYLNGENSEGYYQIGVQMIRELEFDQCFDLWMENDNQNVIVYLIKDDPYVDFNKSKKWLEENMKNVQVNYLDLQCREICLNQPQLAVDLILKQFNDI